MLRCARQAVWLLVAGVAWIGLACGGSPPVPHIDKDQDGFSQEDGDCNDNNPLIRPGSAEACDGLDNDCDNQTDEGVKYTFHADADQDGHGNPAATIQACVPPAGHASSGDDCDDTNPFVSPSAAESCDGIDNDCDGSIDDGVKSIFHADLDQDGYGDPSASTQACSAPTGYVVSGGDCDDTKSAIHPGAAEICDNVDDDCNGNLLACSLTLPFDKAADLGLLVKEGSNSCSEYGIRNGGLDVYCPNEHDLVYWVNYNIQGATRIRASVTLYTYDWNDGGPRNGIDFGTGFSFWGPPSGYAFYMSDPIDSQQGSRCSNPEDTCPSIAKNGSSILDLKDIRTQANDTYSLNVTLGPDGENFDVSFQNTTHSMRSTDKTIRSGRVGLHCSEGGCVFSNLSLWVE